MKILPIKAESFRGSKLVSYKYESGNPVVMKVHSGIPSSKRHVVWIGDLINL